MMTAQTTRLTPSGHAVVAMVALLVCAPWPRTVPTAQSGDARAFLVRHLGLSQAELRRLDNGGVVAKSLEAKDKREVATGAVVNIKVDADTYLERMADIVSFKRHEAVQQIGVFGAVPTAADLRDMTLDRGDVRDLRTCRVGDCDLNLSAEAIQRFQREVAWGSAEAEQQANSLMRDVLARYVADYRRRGNAAAMEYAGDRTPVDVAGEFRALLESDAGLLEQFPGLTRYAVNYPDGPRDGVRDLIYWSREKTGPAPVVSITHIIMMPVAADPGGAPVRHAVMTRQIYGSRYFDASMGLTLLLPEAGSATPAMYVLYQNRSRLDAFSGLFGGIIRFTVRSRVRSGMAESLGRLKTAMERLGVAPPDDR